MPEQDPQPPVIDYHHPPSRRGWLSRITGWDWTLLVLAAVMIFVWPMTLRTHGYNTGPETVRNMYRLIALRVAVAVLRRNRSLWWIPYLLLIFALPVIADAVTRFYRTPLGDRIATAMYHFWRDLL